MTEIPGADELWGRVARWRLEPVDESFVTHTSRLMAATQDGQPVMLKLTNYPEEIAGAIVLQWWSGDGAVPVLEREGNALLMERAIGTGSLYQQCLRGDDEGPIESLCNVLDRLHRRRAAPLPPTVNLRTWFADLLSSGSADPQIARGKRIAEDLLATEADRVVLHGDLHHQNVLDFGDGRWLAIDPKALFGERAFDYVNIFRNPTTPIAADPARFRERVQQIQARAGLDRTRLLAWIAAFCALSICWGYYPGDAGPDSDQAILRLALELLDEEGELVLGARDPVRGGHLE